MEFVLCSSLSVWVRNCDSLELPDDQREQLDQLIDQLYTTIEQVDKMYDDDGVEQGTSVATEARDMAARQLLPCRLYGCL